MKHKLAILVIAAVMGTGCGNETASSAVQLSPAERFDVATQEMTVAFFSHVPEAATQVGLTDDIVPGTSRRMMDRSIDGETARTGALERALQDLKAIDANSLDPDRQRTHAMLTMLFDGMLSPSRVVDYGTTAGAWTLWYMPFVITQNSGPTVDIPNFLNSQQPVTNAADAEIYLERLASVRAALDGSLESYRHGVQQGAIPPDFIVEKSLAVVQAFVAPAADQNPLYLTFRAKLEKAGVENAVGYSDRALQILNADIIPAYQRIADYLGEIKGSAPHDAGMWRLPNGEALYAAMIRHMTDSHLTAEEVHQTGLAEVKRITTEMDAILLSEGYTEGSVGERMQALNVEPRFLYSNDAAGREKLLGDVRAYVNDMYARLPELFRDLPEHQVEVQAVPEFSQDSAPMGYYNNPAPDGSRPGYYFINLRDTALHPSWTLRTLSYHEAVPGHHLDGASAMERETPPIEKAMASNTSGEGWALYAEQLAAEIGVYKDDPFGNLGRLQAELHRAVRLVTDTGMHAKKWSREQAIDYMVATEGLDEATSTSEIERYVVWPAQALGYKLGQLRILALREEAREALGDAFDIRDFNQQVLNVASAPMPFIEMTVRRWISATGQP
ncbi:MAG TPA: DUF885 domain-containing protein [Woeseiaceae bacterium]|nr:DUF885 domain-containing protein [Woeseiaceae bacterium]